MNKRKSNQVRSFMSDDSRLLDFCETDCATLTVECLLENDGNRSKTAADLGVHERTIYRRLERLKQRAARQGYSPDHQLSETPHGQGDFDGYNTNVG